MAFQLDLRKYQSFYIPVAILAGFLVIAAAIYGSGRRGTVSQQDQGPTEAPVVAGEDTNQGGEESQPELESSPESSKETDLDDFARCLADKGATLYAHESCSHCQDQKSLFGDAVEYLNQVECANESGGWTQTCIDVLENLGEQAGVPTWIFKDGSYLKGKQSLETLAQKTGCPLN